MDPRCYDRCAREIVAPPPRNSPGHRKRPSFNLASGVGCPDHGLSPGKRRASPWCAGGRASGFGYFHRLACNCARGSLPSRSFAVAGKKKKPREPAPNKHCSIRSVILSSFWIRREGSLRLAAALASFFAVARPRCFLQDIFPTFFVAL